VSGVTARAVLLALLLLVAVSVASFYVQIAWGRVQYFADGIPAAAPVTLLFVMTGLMGLPLFRRVGLTRRELLVVYSILLVSGPVLSTGVLFWMLPHAVAYCYFAQNNPQWATTFLPLAPSWFSTTEPGPIRDLFEGAAAVPWSAWWLPLAAWLSFMASVLLATFCILALVRRQWITNERLTFP